MPKTFSELLADAGLTPTGFRKLVRHLTGEPVDRNRTWRWLHGWANPGVVVRAFLILVARLRRGERLPPPE